MVSSHERWVWCVDVEPAAGLAQVRRLWSLVAMVANSLRSFLLVGGLTQIVEPGDTFVSVGSQHREKMNPILIVARPREPLLNLTIRAMMHRYRHTKYNYILWGVRPMGSSALHSAHHSPPSMAARTTWRVYGSTSKP